MNAVEAGTSGKGNVRQVVGVKSKDACGAGVSTLLSPRKGPLAGRRQARSHTLMEWRVDHNLA